MVKDNQKDYIIKIYLIKKLSFVRVPAIILLIKTILTKLSLILLRRLISK